MAADFQEEWISAYLDQELTPEQQKTVEQKLVESSEAERLLADFQSMGTLLRELPAEAAPREISRHIQQQLSRETAVPVSPRTAQPRWRTPRWLTSLLACSAALFLFGVGLFLYTAQQGNLAEQSQLVTRHEPDSLSRELAFPLTEKSGPAPAGRNIEANSSFAAPVAPVPLMAEAFSAVPALPEMTEAAREIVMTRLENSPKLKGKLAPGELVQYISIADDQVAIVELSVVDVARSFGEVQVLLAGNSIVPAEQRQTIAATELAPEETPQGFAVQSRLPQPETSDADTTSAKPESSAQTDQPAAATLSAVTPTANLPHSGLVALYIEASDDQLLKTLEQLEALDSVKSFQVGESSRLASRLYSVVPMENQILPNESWNLAPAASPQPALAQSAIARTNRGQNQSSQNDRVQNENEADAAPEAENTMEMIAAPFLLEQQRASAQERPRWRRSFTEEQEGERLLQTRALPAQNAVAAPADSGKPEAPLTTETVPETEKSLLSGERFEAEATTAYQIPVQLVPVESDPSAQPDQAVTGRRKQASGIPSQPSPSTPASAALSVPSTSSVPSAPAEAPLLMRSVAAAPDAVQPPSPRVRALFVLSPAAP